MDGASRGPARLGFAPHSGWAALVAVAGTPRSPEVVLRERIEMTDRTPGAAQPYHAVEGRPLAEATRRIAGYKRTADALAYEALRSVVEELKARGYAPVASGILQSSGRDGASLEAILASHALIHTADGNHFRDALFQAGRRCGLEVVRVPLKTLAERASEALGEPAAKLQATVQGFKKAVGAPWGADQKSAALVAWMLGAENEVHE
jgi:hypothetical protein